MTRREEITQSAKNKYPYIKGLPQSASNQAVFIEAAEWADKTMIEKACQYLKNALYEVASGVTNSFDIMSIENTTMDDFISSFRNAMEE